MKATGMVRPVDCLGRIVLPIEIRRNLEIEEKDALEIFLDGDRIVLQKCTPSCIFCGNGQNLSTYKGKNICQNCVKQLEDI